MKNVSIVSLSEYDYENAYAAVKKSIELLGGMQKFVQKGDKVLVKVNLLKRAKPEAGITTHPTVAYAIAKLVIEAGGEPTIGDSPGGPFTTTALKSIYEASGMAEAAEKSGAKLSYNTEVSEVNGLRITSMAANADVIISACKLKTHSMMGLTGAAKNMYGVIPGLTKAEYHYQKQSKERFAKLILDINDTVKPKLSVMDAVVGMEGEGPAAGEKRHVGAILASDDALSLDVAAAYMIGMDTEYAPILKCALEEGRIGKDISSINILGENIEKFKCEFVRPQTLYSSLMASRIPDFLRKIIEKKTSLYPRFKKDGCIKCGICAANCPAKAIDMSAGYPKLDKKSCIRCYCCHELCPKHIVEMKRPFIWKAATKIFK